MKSNNFQQPQSFLNNSLNKNPYRIQNYNYMFYLIQDNPQLYYSIQNYYLQLYQLSLLQYSQQAQLFNLPNGQNVQNIQNVLPLYYNIAFNNPVQLRLLNSNNNILSQNQNLPPYINNINGFQNNFQNIQNIENKQNIQNDISLNKKTFKIEHNAVKKENKIENKIIESKDINENQPENNNTSLINNEIKTDENNLEIKSIEIREEDYNIIEKNELNEISKTKKEEKNEISTTRVEEKDELSTTRVEEKDEISTTRVEEKDEISTTKVEEKNEISITKKEEKNEEEELKTKKETKKKKKKRANYKDLLYDSLLERIGKEEKTDSKKGIELEEEEISSPKKKEKNKKSTKTNNPKTKQKQKHQTKNGKHSRKKQHKITLKNNKDILADLEENKNNEDNSKYTRIIFHGKDYKKTSNINEFMKYNFDFVVDEEHKTKKIMSDNDQQHVDVKAINGNKNIYDNYNYIDQHLDEINNIWSREKFIGNNNELKKAINVLRDSYNERKIYTNEEKYLDIIKNNNYKINGFTNKKN